MAALSAITPARTGTASAGAAVAASDTISSTILGVNGAFLEIINGNASDDTMSISDSGSTPAGTAPGTFAATVTAGTNKVFFISPKQLNPSTGVVTVTHSVTTTVTYKLYPIPSA